MSLAAVILAAGRASRMGTCKQLLPIGRETLVTRAVRSAREAMCSPILVVTGAHSREVRCALGDTGAVSIFNRHWRSGIASSIRVGLRCAGSTEAVFLLLADQPFVGAPLLRLLHEALESSGKTAAACRYDGTVGAPALFRPGWIPQLVSLTGDRGAGDLLARRKSALAIVDFPEGRIDLDTPEDARRWLPRVLDQSDVAGLAVHPRIDEEASVF